MTNDEVEIVFEGLRNEVRREDLPVGKKIVHFVRHGQGFHNEAASMEQTGCVCGVNGDCVYTRDEFMDARLTTKGREEASKVASLKLRPELVVVSPLTRTLQTATIAFERSSAPIVVREEVREVLGLHITDRRRSLSVVKSEFPKIHFADHLENLDSLFISYGGQLEPIEEVWKRGRDALLWIRDRPEKEIAVVSHSGFLRRFLNGGVTCHDPKLKERWATGECRSFLVTYA